MVKATYLREQTRYKAWSSRLGVLREVTNLSKEKNNAKKSQQRTAGLINGRRQRRAQREQQDNDIRNDTKKLKMKNWTSRIQDRNEWEL